MPGCVDIHHVKSCSAMEGLAGMKNYMKAWPTGSEILVNSSSLSYVMAGPGRDKIFVDICQSNIYIIVRKLALSGTLTVNVIRWFSSVMTERLILVS
ncbi:MAG: hypothetical protein MRQ09_05710 [Candidatus Midichloria sp.]|nr:hypothetical protein [Candidatus Midichloria sp.]